MSAPPTSASAPTIPYPVARLYSSKAQAAALLTSSPIAWLDPIGMKLHAATISSVSPTQLVAAVPAAPGGTITFSLTGDGTAEIPIAAISP